MAYFNHGEVFGVDKAILAFTDGNGVPISVSVKGDHVGLNAENKRTVPAGLFVAEIGDVRRFLPRAKVIAPVTASSPTIMLNPYNIFVPEDELYVVEPYAVLTITSVAVGQTVEVTVNGRTAKVTAESPSPAMVAAQVAVKINSAPIVADLISAIAGIDGKVHISAKDGISNYSISKGGTATTSLDNSKLTVNPEPVGTVAYVNNTTGAVTLTDDASVALPVGARVGVPVTKILGLHVHPQDYTNAPVRDLACYTEARGVRIQYLPYLDGDIQRRFPQMLFDYRF